MPAKRMGGVSRPWLLPLAAAGIGALLLGLSFAAGRQSGSADLPAVQRENSALRERSAELEERNATLEARVTELDMARKVDREAYGQIEQTLGDLQSQLARQGDDLAFYRSIVSPEDGVQGLRIQRFEVERGEAEREYRLRLTLIQAMRHESTAAGLANVILHGVEDGRPARYSVGDLLERPRAQLPFSFRYFQTVEQAVTLPEGFEPFEAEVQVRSSKLRTPLQQTFAWKVA
jgi:hypothetical protein